MSPSRDGRVVGVLCFVLFDYARQPPSGGSSSSNWVDAPVHPMELDAVDARW